jgi:hypothetical protein
MHEGKGERVPQGNIQRNTSTTTTLELLREGPSVK